MSFIVYQGKKVYYEIHGEQEETLLILNGIMMSSASWQAFLPMLKKHQKVVLVDFFDQGKSDYLEGAYTQEIQGQVVKELITSLNLKKVTLLGISYGGEVAMKVAIDHEHLIDRLILANTTAYTNQQLKAIGDAWVYAAQTGDGRIFFKNTIPPIYSTGFYERNIDWLTAREALFVKAFDERWYQGFARLVVSAETHDERQRISQITVPTLIIGADEDLITPLACQKELYRAIKNSRFVVIQDCGHASMYEKPTEFFGAVLGFIQTAHENFTI